MEGERDVIARETVLAALGRGESVTRACALAGVARTLPYMWARRGDVEMRAALEKRSLLGGQGSRGDMTIPGPVDLPPAEVAAAAEIVEPEPEPPPQEALDEPPLAPAQEPQKLPGPQDEDVLIKLKRMALGQLATMASGKALPSPDGGPPWHIRLAACNKLIDAADRAELLRTGQLSVGAPAAGGRTPKVRLLDALTPEEKREAQEEAQRRLAL